MVEIIIGIVIGGVAGWLASIIMKSGGSLLRNVILGVLGGFIGNFVMGLLKISFAGYFGSILVSVIGACILIAAVRFITKK